MGAALSQEKTLQKWTDQPVTWPAILLKILLQPISPISVKFNWLMLLELQIRFQ